MEESRTKNLNRGFQYISTKIQEYEKKILKRHNLNVTTREMWYIVLIHDNPGKKIDEVAQAAAVTKSTMSNQLRILLNKKLVTKSQSLKDRRIKSVKLTVEGHKIYDLHKKIRSRIKELFHGEFKEEEIDFLVYIGKKIIEKIKKL